MYAAREEIIGADRYVRCQQSLHPKICLRAIRSNKLRFSAKNRGRDSRYHRMCATSTRQCKHAGSIFVGRNLFKTLHAVLLDGSIEKCEGQPVIEKTEARPYRPFFRRT